MELILLSGGSGKRLWPLSDDTRSKQFLQVLESPNGAKESMIQRVFRQLHETKLTENIILSTNEKQVNIIKNQLGENVTIITEPERRDTFPAIALASSYLKFTKKCPDDEIVVVMPCDSYTEKKYFETIRKMTKLASQDIAEIILMGITPTYPSEKYGYIVPDNSNSYTDYKKVSYFTEKPNIEQASKLLKINALWNGGVFAFRLGHIMDIIKKYINSDTFEDIRKQYTLFPKISFDYEVTEKAKSIVAVPFDGIWKDLGTWNSLTEELHNPIIGNAKIGKNCESSHIINELSIPIYADGIKNTIIVASHSGIMVCNKEDKFTEKIKDIVGIINLTENQQIQEEDNSRILDDTIYENEQRTITKIINLNLGKNLLGQTDERSSKVWIFTHGKGIYICNGKEQQLYIGKSIIIQPNSFYSIKAIEPLTFIEVHTISLI